MNYINKTTKEYPVYETHIKARNKGFDDYEVVINTELPTYNKYTQMCVELEPELRADGKYYKRYEVQDKTGETLQDGMEKLKLDMSKAIQTMVDTKARELRWDDIKSARAGAGVPLDGTESEAEIAIYNEALKLAKWDRSVWAKAGEIEAEILAGTRPMPTTEELLAELPVFGA